VKRIFICTLVFSLSLFQALALAWADDPVSQQTRTQYSAELRQMVDMGVPETVANKMQSRFEASQMVQVQSILQTAKAQGLPIEPLADKALEGIAKKVPADRIVKAMEQVQSRYAAAMADAQEITPTQARQRSLSRTMAQAMSAGMQPEEIEAIADRLRTRERTMTRDECDQLAETTFTAARDMVRMGASAAVVADTINMAIEEGYTADQMQHIRSQFMHQAQQIDADMVANQFRERVRTGQDVGDDGSGTGQGKDDAGSGAGSGYGNSGAQSGGNGGSTSGSGNSDGSGNGAGSGSNSGAGSGNGGGTNSGSGGNSTGSGSSGTSGSSSGSSSGSDSGSSSGSGSGSSGSGGSGSGGGKK
jgi:hypothetical protein